MTGALEFFLSYNLQRSDEHSKGYPWHVLDREGVHQDLLQLLFRESSAFGQTLLGHGGRCTRNPSRGLFDLVVQSDDATTYLEIKVDHEWKEHQQLRQIDLLRSQSAKGRLVVLSKSACEVSHQQVASVGDGLFSKISYAELYNGLESAIGTDGRPAFSELCVAYKKALVEQEQRARVEYAGEPNF